MNIPEIEVDKVLLKRWLRLFTFRVLILLAHCIAIIDGLGSLSKYSELQDGDKGLKNMTRHDDNEINTLPTPVTKPPMIGYCNMRKKVSTKDLGTQLLNFHMSLIILLGFYVFAIVNFIIKTVVHLRLALCPIWQEPDACGRVPPTKWDKVRDTTFNLATFPCDVANMCCIIVLYATKRGTKGLGCWQCFLEPDCVNKKKFEDILFTSSLALNVNFILVLWMVFYKGFITFFRSTDPEKCDCHCVIPRCVTGCFVSLILTSVILMPAFATMKDKYFSIKEVDKNDFVSTIMGNMMTIGVIVWVIAGIFLLIIMPLKMILMRNRDPKKK